MLFTILRRALFPALLVILLGTGSARANDKLTLLLDWFVNPDHAPLFVAQEQGYFAAHGLEVEMIRLAHEMDLVTTPYCFVPDEATMMAEAGADIVVAHMGLTTKGSIGATTAVTLEQAPAAVQEIADAAKAANPDVIVLCHGGPISEPEDAAYVLQRTDGVHGFYGASSMERLPVETALTEQMRAFNAVRFE